MSRYVLDASVIVKWLIPENPDEHNVQESLALLMLYVKAVSLYINLATGRYKIRGIVSESFIFWRNFLLPGREFSIHHFIQE